MSHSKVLCKYYLFHHKTKSIFHHNNSIFHHTTKSISHHKMKSIFHHTTKSISHHKMKSIFHHTTKSIFHHEHTTKSIFHHAVKSSNRFLAPLCDAVGSFGCVCLAASLLCISSHPWRAGPRWLLQEVPQQLLGISRGSQTEWQGRGSGVEHALSTCFTGEQLQPWLV